MAGGTITRIVGGNLIKEIEGDYTIRTNNYTVNSGGKISFTSDKEIIFGSPPPPPDAGKYFKKGWWSSDPEGNKKIKTAELDDVVYFQIELTGNFPSKNKNLPEDKRKKKSFKVYWFDGYNSRFGGIYPLYRPINEIKKEEKQEIGYITWTDSNNNNELDEEEKHTERSYNEIEARGNRATLSFHLNKSLERLFVNYSNFELFIEVSYDGEMVELPEEENFLSVTPKVKEIYVKLLNYRVSSKVTLALGEIQAYQQYIQGNDDKQSQKVNMDYFSVRIDKLPQLEGGIRHLYKLIMKHFLALASGSIDFKGNGLVPQSIDMSVNGRWQFKPYPKEDDEAYVKEQVRKWDYEVNHPIFYIEADSDDFTARQIVDHGAVIMSEFDEMCWLFTTINTKESDTQPFSGHRQFGIHQDEDGYYRIFTRAIDRVWPSEYTKGANLKDVDATVKDYLAIADGTWTTYMNHLFIFITFLGGEATIMKPEIMRIDFHKFLEKYNDEQVTHIGNIPQYKYYEK